MKNTVIKKILVGLSLSFTVQAMASTFWVGNLQYATSTSGATVVACNPQLVGDVVVPDSVTDSVKVYVVNTIGRRAFEGVDRLEHITLPATLRHIDDNAFQGCKSLSQIDIPEGVERIGYQSFMQCSALSSISLPKSISAIGDGAFWRDWSLTHFTVNSANANFTAEGGALFNKRKTLLICFPAGNPVAVYSIPKTVTSIVTGAFAYCKDLNSVVIPEDVVDIRKYAFEYCTHLESITLPQNVTDVEDGTFLGCRHLKSITLPKGLNSIGDEAFRDCNHLQLSILPRSLTTVGNSAFKNCQALTELTFPSGVKSIADSAFLYCDNIRNLHLFGLQPPFLGTAAFSDTVEASAMVYVRQTAVLTYKFKEQWLRFGENFLREIPTYKPYKRQ